MRATHLIGLAACLLASFAYSAPLTPVSPAPPGATEGIVVDLQTGDYVITYEAADEYTPKGLYQTIYTPANKIDPTIVSYFRIAEPGTFSYEYKIRNGRNSRQSLEIFVVEVSNIHQDMVTPTGWNGSTVAKFNSPGLRVGWSYGGSEDLGGLPRGKTLGGFGFKSADLPGVGMMQFSGAAPIHAYAGNGPSKKILDELENIDRNDFVARIVAVPRVPVPNPYNTATALTSLQKHIKDDMISLNLIDPVFLTQLDRSLQAAVDAAKINNTAGVKQNLQDLRKALKKAHHDIDDDDGDDEEAEHQDPKQKSKPILIGKLAARIIDFDVKYVLKRLGGDKGG